MHYLSYKNQMLSECESNGFRLEQLEVYNWGTFNQRVWIMSPCSGTALLTGANASGKSTLADALLTLLVPSKRRTYNQASGTEKHAERDERSYILGAWRKQKDESSNQARPEYLRDKSSYTVLLAIFHNAYSQRDVTLAQVLRIQDEEVAKSFVVAQSALHIADHFRLTGTLTDLNKELRARGAEVFRDFGAYSHRFRQLVNVRSEKAFDLFNQIVSIKEIGGLNAFVRDHMLEKTDARERIADLKTNFDNLTRSHKAIQLAQEQLNILEPLVDNADKYAEQQRRISEAQQCIEIVPFYIAMRKQRLLESAIAETAQELTIRQGDLETITLQLNRLRDQQLSLKVSISSDQVEQQITQLKQEMQYLATQQQHKQREADKYNAVARSLHLPEYRDQQTFDATLRKIASLFEDTTTRLNKFKDERDTYVQELSQTKGVHQALQKEVLSLKQRKSQILADDVTIRSQITSSLHIAEDDLPFVGELLRVRDSERRWEGAVERLLHSFGRQLLVPEQYYREVSRFIDMTYLGKRLVYQQVKNEPRTPRNKTFSDSIMLYNKLDIKPNTAFSKWLYAEIIDRYDYQCCETLEEFQQARRALSIRGQIKHSHSLHEKDDRKKLDDRTTYILGWNNAEKLAALESQLMAQSKTLSHLEDALERITEKQSHEDDIKRNLQRLDEFNTFTTIDWHTDERQRLVLDTRVRELEANSSLSALRRQLVEVEAELKKTQQASDILNRAIAALDSNFQQYQRQHTLCMHNHQGMSGKESLLAIVEKEHGTREFALETVDQEVGILSNFYSRRVSSLQGISNQLSQHLVLSMEKLRTISPSFAQEVDASINAIGQYRRFYEQVKRDDLPKHAKRFKELLNDKVVIDINSFKVALERQERAIEERVKALNESLAKIDYSSSDYSSSTYIQLCCERTRDQEVRNFRNELRACLPDVSQQRTPEANEASFQRIHALLQKFETDARWTAKVTTVSHWLDFAAEELYREDGKRRSYYSDSSGKSGGQKTKLAYTILASAIAYQYGLDQEEGSERAFRFVVIDEAFVRSDETNARYAMELFKQLNLQLLVITPLDKIHIIEPYISACHYAINNEEENDSKVYNLSIQQYYQQKQTIQAGAMVSDYTN